jgi:hypothetical protein
MSVTLETILSGKNLVGVIQGIKSGVPEDLLPPAWLAVSRRVSGDNCTYLKVEGTRQTAKLVQYGSPSRARQLKGVSEIAVKLLHTFEHQHLSPATLIKLKDPNTDQQDKGMWEVSRQTAEFKRYFTNLRISAIYSALCSGKILFDLDGNLLTSAAGTPATTIDFGVPAGNKDQLDVFGGGDIIDAAWDAAATKIIAQIKNLKKAARKLTGYPLTTAFYGASIPDWLATNTACAALIVANNRYQEAFAAGDIPGGFAGIKNWIPLHEAFFADSGDTKRDWLADDFVVFAPDPTPDWWEVTEGSYLVPNSLNISADGVAAIGNLTEVNGMFSYATLESDPPTIKQLAGDTFLPILKVPKAIFIADVDF